MANPRKFSEKIALHHQKQAEETAAFEQIMREVSDATSKVLPISHFPFSIARSSLAHCQPRAWILTPPPVSSKIVSQFARKRAGGHCPLSIITNERARIAFHLFLLLLFFWRFVVDKMRKSVVRFPTFDIVYRCDVCLKIRLFPHTLFTIRFHSTYCNYVWYVISPVYCLRFL